MKLTPEESSLEKRANEMQRRNYLTKRGLVVGQPVQMELLVGDIYDNRFIPNDYARSALFTTRNRKEPRRLFERVKIYHLHEGRGVSILYTGVELRAEDDEVVWMQILRYAERAALGDPFEFTAREMLRDLQWTPCGRNYQRINEILSRLKANEILLLNQNAYGKSGSMSLLEKYEAVNDTNGQCSVYKVWIDPKMALLFAGGTFTKHDWTAFLKLSPLARRMADYINSHKVPNPLSIDQLQLMCDSVAEKRTFKRSALKCFDELKEQQVIVFAKLDNGMITFVRPGARNSAGPNS